MVRIKVWNRSTEKSRCRTCHPQPPQPQPPHPHPPDPMIPPDRHIMRSRQVFTATHIQIPIHYSWKITLFIKLGTGDTVRENQSMQCYRMWGDVEQPDWAVVRPHHWSESMEVIKISGKQLRTRRTRSQDGSRQTVLVSEPHGSQCLISFRNMCQCSRTNGNRVDGCYGLLLITCT